MNKLDSEIQEKLIELDGELWDYQLDKLVALIQQREAELLATLQTAVLAAAPEKFKELGGAVVQISGKKYAQGHNAAIDQYTRALHQLFESEEPNDDQTDIMIQICPDCGGKGTI